TAAEAAVAGSSRELSTRRSRAQLARRGGVGLLRAAPEASRYGEQTGTTHGGLLLSRSPTVFWHEAPGRLRDVDMKGCYNRIIARLGLYWGRPVILEPGARGTSLREAVDLCTRHAEPDAWLVRVSGPIAGYLNTLIPSTEGALTSLNYRS